METTNRDRFKGKISTINRQGNIECPNASAIPTRCSKPPVPLSKSKPVPLPPKQPNDFIKPAYNIVTETESPFNVKPAVSEGDLFSANPYPDIEKLLQMEAKENSGPGNSCGFSNKVLKRNTPKAPEAEPTFDRKHIRDTAYQQINPLHLSKMAPAEKPQRSYSLPRGDMEKKVSVMAGDQKATTKYYALGGLGANVGGEEWSAKKEKQARMTEYAKAVTKVNKSRPAVLSDKPPLPRKMVPEKVEEAKRKKEKMLEYSKRVPKPKKARGEAVGPENAEAEEKTEPVRELTELEKLELQHNEYMEQIEKLKHVVLP